MIDPVSREEMFRRLQVVRVVDPILREQYEAEELAKMNGDVEVNHRAADWHLSFHASSFPLSEETACGRKALYGLMNLPATEPTPPHLVAMSEAGLDIENRVLARFEGAGVLLSSTDQKKQTNFASRRYWLVGHGDAIILPPNFRRPHPVEIKTKSDSKIDEMQAGQRSYELNHKAQLMTYIYFTRRAHEALGFDKKGLTPAEDGTILYISRDNPRKTAEFWIDWDEEEFQKGLDRLESWKQAFIDKEIPERPKHFMWGQEPCKWCGFKKLCKSDYQSSTTKLTDSSAIAQAVTVDPSYDFDAVYTRMLDRWK